MPAPLSPGVRALLRTRPRQPDARSCGAACLVMARALREEEYAVWLAEPGRFRSEALRAHRRSTSLRGGAGVRLPWPRALGTAPWSVVSELSTRAGSWRVRWLRRGSAATAEQVAAAIEAGHPVVLFVGSRTLPRHVVLAVALDREHDVLAVYDPAPGALRALPLAALRRGRTGFTQWQTTWWAVLPPGSP